MIRSLREAWDASAHDWIRWAREPDHDSYWRFHRDAFYELLPPPGLLTLDLGCGEGRVTRDLKTRGHRVVGIDGSATLVGAAKAEDPTGDYRVADAAALPCESGAFDLVVSFMVLHDVDDLEGALRECARVLRPGGRLCAAIVHPLNSAGHFQGEREGSPFVIEGSYLSAFRYEYAAKRAGIAMTFHSEHRSLETTTRAFEQAGLLLEALREPPAKTADPMSDAAKQWLRVPLFLHLRAVKPSLRHDPR